MSGTGIEFRVTTPGGLADRERFEGDELLVGRAPRCGLTINDPALSPVHLRLKRYPEGWRAEDFGGGVLLGGASLGSSSPLRPGDLLTLGGTRMEILDAGGSTARPLDETASYREDMVALRSTLRWYEERLQILSEVQRDLAGPVEMEEVLGLILEMVFKHLGPVQAAVYLLDPEGAPARLAAKQLHEEVEPLELSPDLLREVLPSGSSAQVFDASGPHPSFEGVARLAPGVRSVVVAPLVGPLGPVGLLALSSILEPLRFSVQDLDLLTSLASAGALRIHSLALAREAAERRRLQEEIALARRIQVALLPSSLPEIPGYEIHGVNLPYEGVSGDYFMVLPRAEGRELALWVADVCGKGIAASLLMASLEALSAGPIERGDPPEEVLAQVSRLLYERTSREKYATAILAVLDPGTGVVRYANAGHNPALLVRGSGVVEWLDSTGVPLGLLTDRGYTARQVRLGRGDLLALYTDGFTEARDPDEEEFGAHRLAQVCLNSRGKPLEHLAEDLRSEMEAFVRGVPYDDDRTLVLLKRT